MRSSRFAVGADEYIVISYELDEPRPSELLTPAEGEVALFLVRGWSLTRIAKARRRSRRTIANQAQSIYRKLRVTSRLELAALLRKREP
jgi:DNA-binding NarL/FixJ family response regulator